MRLEIVQLPKPIHRAVAYSLGFRQGPAAPVRHAFGFGFQSRGNQCVSLLLSILGLASPAGLNLPERTDPGGAHALAPQGSGMAIDVIGGSNFQVLLAGGRRQDQAAAQGHLLRRAGRRFPRSTCSRSSAAKLTSGLILAMRTHISYWPQYVYLFMIHTIRPGGPHERLLRTP